ncbi:NADH dehydrogenase [ubiquinone] 1 alpha subcomplex assembly factor 8 isoform X2 [Fukomys damarensis]|uniref:NADH dehydrogenase [ubiquinone] 1 alpha subcomplex assembly factor 8 isoform X2 n=1 Tax=Fukomys damarensis TaxID=885580 RepID=UPI000540169B|nr:NADH dehydrogenase [ubiquinone] 1 alpha subcomplex assembly factor 8 isoform X2 [Fukomys damarensis]
MSANGAVWRRVRNRFRAFPERLAAPGAESLPRFPGAPGGRRPGGRLSKDLCAREFEALRSCFVAAAKKSLKGGS